MDDEKTIRVVECFHRNRFRRIIFLHMPLLLRPTFCRYNSAIELLAAGAFNLHSRRKKVMNGLLTALLVKDEAVVSAAFC